MKSPKKTTSAFKRGRQHQARQTFFTLATGAFIMATTGYSLCTNKKPSQTDINNALDKGANYGVTLTRASNQQNGSTPQPINLTQEMISKALGKGAEYRSSLVAQPQEIRQSKAEPSAPQP